VILQFAVGVALRFLVAAAAYLLFVLVKPVRHCPKCNGWGQRAKRRRRRQCARCKGTGKTFRPAARLVHKGAAAAYKQARARVRARMEAEK